MARDPGNRDSFLSTTSSAWVDRHDSSDWIGPCASEEPPVNVDHHKSLTGKTPKATTRRRISSASETGNARELWECMLELQQRYGCYRSARMEAAICAYDGTDLMPSKACLDLLNESIVDEELPEEGWKMLGKFVPDLREVRREKNSWKFWKRH